MKPMAYITAMGKFLPNSPISNDEMESYLGEIGGKPSRLRERILKKNGIQSRHYAIERGGKANYWNCDLAANAALDAISRSEIMSRGIGLLTAATSQSDLLAPGFAGLVHGKLQIPPCEIASFQGICASGVSALKYAMQSIVSGEHNNALVCASEFSSRYFRRELFEETRAFKEKGRINFDSEFLRWMLSDGAGAAILESQPNDRSNSLRVDWIDLVSYADRLDVCMYAGVNKDKEKYLDRPWGDYSSFAEAAADGVFLLKQDITLLDNIVLLGVARYFELIERGLFKPDEVDWLVCHYSSHIFRSKIIDLLTKGGGMIPEERWFTNLYEKGNTGSASIFIMLEELFNEGKLKSGDKILCMIPESGRFTVSYMHLTVVGPTNDNNVNNDSSVTHIETKEIAESININELSYAINIEGDDLQSSLLRRLALVWADFETRLRSVPIIDKLNRGKLRVDDYQLLLLNLRQQVMEGARWIARAASNITIEHFPLRSLFIGHAGEEHRDYQMIERDYLATGGTLEEIQSAEKNIGSEALSAWVFDRANRENPFDLLGAMFIIEGLGMRMARQWGLKIQEQLRLSDKQVSFLLYHGANDENHFAKFETALAGGILTEELVQRIVKTAKVTARLYLLQLEELGNV